ncbi:hypothetical protein FRC98_02035 [Lujinxingia vulgaris]|uniref:HEAT repeat domain-containing protein n=1 Tax=Lujinxingia vulgaris TaxID=2600176 RepID=A0A5C6XNK9_9DELT|nr:hypothetical protein [Lujinxingia vulgaris]TXD39202.1 hypothetical protein FRC98_02035 [Lujinxingia vulgaris]
MQDGQPSGAQESSVAISPETQEEVRLARRCFAQIERLTTVMTGYPPGHPVVENALKAVRDAFYDFFEITDRLTVQIHPHWMDLYGSGEMVWETSEPRDYCFALSRDGVYLIHILAGVDEAELRVLVGVLNELVDQRDLTSDAASLLFEAGFRYISYDAIDESLALLAGLDNDVRNRDTREEQEMIEELFNDAFDKDLEESAGGGQGMEQDFEVRLQRRGEQQMKLEVGSRQFLQLDEEAQAHLLDLKRGFTEHHELEHRQGEVLSALLGARPRAKLRRGAVAQIGNVMGTLLETAKPWEALSFLKLIHHWRDKFPAEVAGELKDAVKECFTPRRIQALNKQVATAEQGPRRAILQMYNALHLEAASEGLVEVLGWNLEDETRDDILRYIRQRARRGLDFIERALPRVSGERAEPLVDLLAEMMPRSRALLLEIVRGQMEPPIKLKALKAMRGTWGDVNEVRDVLVPLVRGSHSGLRLEALQALAAAMPAHVLRVVEPLLDTKLAKRPEEEVRELVGVLIKHGGAPAVEKLRELVQRRGIVAEEEQELAVAIVRAMIKSPTPEVVALLNDVAKDWLVAGRIRSTCKEVVELIQ